AIGRSNLDEARAAPLHDFRDAEAAADLHELAARDDRPTSVSERVERENERRRAVVDDERVFGAGELPQQRRAVGITSAATASLDVVLEVGVPARDSGHGADRRIGERRPAQVRVEHDTRCVDYRAERWADDARQLPLDGGDPGRLVARWRIRRPGGIERRACGVNDGRSWRVNE